MKARSARWHYSPVVEARHLGAHRVWLKFADGLEGELDLASELWGPVFEPLADPAYFARFTIDRTLCWPNGADFSPEYLWDRVRFEGLGIKPPRTYPEGFPTSATPKSSGPRERAMPAKKRTAPAPREKRASSRRA